VVGPAVEVAFFQSSSLIGRNLRLVPPSAADSETVRTPSEHHKKGRRPILAGARMSQCYVRQCYLCECSCAFLE